MADRSRSSIKFSGVDDSVNDTPDSASSSSPAHLCVNCCHYKVVLDPGGNSRSPVCGNRQHPRFLALGAPACELFDHKMLTTEEVAKMVNVDSKTIRRSAERWQDTGGSEGLPSIKLGQKLWRFPREGVIAYLEKRLPISAMTGGQGAFLRALRPLRALRS